MLAYIDYSEPKLFNGRSVMLLLVLSFLAYLVSPLNPMRKEEQRGLLLVYPILIFVYWLQFQVQLVSLNPYVHYYLGPAKVFTWMTNTYICLVFGAGFSASIVLARNGKNRAYGGLFLAFYILLILVRGFQPAVQQT